MKCSILYSVSLALLGTVTVLAQSDSSARSEIAKGNNAAQAVSNNQYGSSSVESPSEQKAKELSDPKPPAPAEPADKPQDEIDESQLVYITQPSEPKTYNKGDKVLIEWLRGNNRDIMVEVLVGKEPKNMQKSGVHFPLKGDDGDFEWTIPESLSAGTYAFQFNYKVVTGKGNVTQSSYSNSFVIKSSTKPSV